MAIVPVGRGGIVSEFVLFVQLFSALVRLSLVEKKFLIPVGLKFQPQLTLDYGSLVHLAAALDSLCL